MLKLWQVAKYIRKRKLEFGDIAIYLNYYQIPNIIPKTEGKETGEVQICDLREEDLMYNFSF